jgi:hypothetical protein
VGGVTYPAAVPACLVSLDDEQVRAGRARVVRLLRRRDGHPRLAARRLEGADDLLARDPESERHHGHRVRQQVPDLGVPVIVVVPGSAQRCPGLVHVLFDRAGVLENAIGVAGRTRAEQVHAERPARELFGPLAALRQLRGAQVTRGEEAEAARVGDRGGQLRR